MVRFLLIFLVSILSSQILFAQKSKDQAGLVSKAEKIEIILESLIYKDQKASRPYIDSLIALNKNENCLKCETLGLKYDAIYQSFFGNLDKAVSNMEKANLMARKNNDWQNIKVTNSYIASFLMDMNKNEEVENFLNELVNEYKIENDSIIITETYYLLGMCYYNQGYLKKSIETLLDAKNYNNESDPNYFIYNTGIYSDIARSYRELNIYKQSKKYFEDALLFAKKSGNDIAINNVLLNQAINEIELNDVEKGLKLIDTPYVFFEKINDGHRVNGALLFRSLAFYKLGKHNLANEEIEKVFDFYEKSNDLIRLSKSYALKSKIQYATKDYEGALASSTKAYEIIKNLPLQKEKIHVLKNHFKILFKNKEFEKAAQLSMVLDSIEVHYQKRIEKDNFFELEKKYNTEKKEQEIKLLSAENELAKKQKYLYVGVMIVIGIIGMSIFFIYRNKIKTAEKINELNELKSKFFANISHEFRTPLTLIKSPVQLLQVSVKEEEQKKKLDLIDSNTNRMLELVDQLLELSKLDNKSLKLIYKEGNITAFISALIEPFEFQAKENSQIFQSNIQKSHENHLFDKDVLQKIISNLLSNALKYTPIHETIKIKTYTEKNILHLTISNSGVRLKQEEVPKIFERFYQDSQSLAGAGIGLSLVKELIDLYEGKIQTHLENNVLTFEVTLPLRAKNQDDTKVNIAYSNDNFEEQDMPILLIVDDHTEIRKILSELFSDAYKILEAANGEQAIKMAQKEIPDCIISDVMMPQMDGFSFTKAIKSHELTSFIPVLLLTAKNSDATHLEGLKSMADAFLTKPFNHEILKETVRGLIIERKKLQLRYSQELILKPVDIFINSVDEKFLEKLQNIINIHITNPDFTAEEFAKQIGMSRMQLHRKLKSLLGVTATEFIRNERLTIALELLKKETISISEIAYSVGFNDVSYFSKCFKERFGVSPSEYT
ncbi:MAG: response regulator [Flavobacterium sp.]